MFPKIRRVVALTLTFCIDFAIFYSSGFVPARSASGRLARLWSGAALRGSAAALSLLSFGEIRAVYVRFLVVQCVLPAAIETGNRVLYGEESRCALQPDGRCWLTAAGAALAAALFWETICPSTDDSAAGRESKQKAGVLVLRVVRLYKPESLTMAGGFFFLSLAVICETFIPLYTGRIIDALRDQDQGKEFFSALMFMALYSLGSSVGSGCRGGLFLCAISSFTCRAKVNLFKAFTKQEISFFESTQKGDLTLRLTEDTRLMGETVCLKVNVLLRTFIRTVGMIYLMMNLSWKLTFLVLMETPVTGLIQSVYNKHHQRLHRATQTTVAAANEAASASVSAIHLVRSSNAEKHESRRYEDLLMNTHNIKTRRDTVRAFYLLALKLTGVGMQVLMLFYGHLFIQRGQMTTGNLVSFILYQSDLGHNIMTLTSIWGQMVNSVVAAGKVFEYMDREPQVSTDGTLRPDRLAGNVSLRRLRFAYPSNPHKTVLKDFSMELKPGQMTALVGPSGEGKSTCMSLLKRFYEPLDGEILLDDVPLKSYEHRFLQEKIAYVSQEPVLFSGSIRDNIAYGLAECSLDKVEEAARKADAHCFIQNMEKGYDTEVGECGGKLSKSERQQIAIARALVRDPKVLILDEITSSLDPNSENKVLQALARCHDQALLVIAHRLKTIEKAGQIIVIGDGRVQEQGTHGELMDLKGKYYKLREELFTDKNSPA